jgi:plasmid stabilization system protein ParE
MLRDDAERDYVVFFRPIEDGIEVARIVHGSRDLRSLEVEQ